MMESLNGKVSEKELSKLKARKNLQSKKLLKELFLRADVSMQILFLKITLISVLFTRFFI